MNKAVVIGIIAAVAVGIGITLAITTGLEGDTAVESNEMEVETSESGGKDIKITLKEDLGIEGKPP